VSGLTFAELRAANVSRIPVFKNARGEFSHAKPGSGSGARCGFNPAMARVRLISDKTGIEWTDATWNPIRARNRATAKVGHFCIHVSEGCRNCYAERMQPRFGNPIRYAAQDRDKIQLFLDEKVLAAPLRWREPRRIFVCSMTDLFLEDHPDEWIDRIFAVMALCPWHKPQVLTKRPERMRAYMRPGKAVALAAEAFEMTIRGIYADPESRIGTGVMLVGDIAHLRDWPLPNVWLGVSVEDQATADERIPILLKTPAAIRFLSIEPMLGSVDLRRWIHEIPADNDGDRIGHNGGLFSRIDWLIVGGESGPGARPMHPGWARSLRDQCVAAGVPFFFKQWGEWCPSEAEEQPVYRSEYRHLGGSVHAHRIGKKAAGRMLDGRTWDEFPA